MIMLELSILISSYPMSVNLFRVNNKNTKTITINNVLVSSSTIFYSIFPPGICFSRPSALGPPGPIKFVSAVFDFLPVCVVKCSGAALVKYNFEFSIHKY